MKRISLSFMILCPLVFAGCKSSVKTAPWEDLPHEIIKYASLKQLTYDDLPESILGHALFVKLDETEEQFMFSGIDDIKVIDDRIYLLDWRNRGLIVFDIEGKGLGRVGRQGRGPDEYLQISDFDVDDKGNIWIVDGQKDYIFLYDRDLNFISSRPFSFDANTVQCLPGGRLLFTLTTWNELDHKGVRILLCDQDLNVIDTYLEYDEYIDNNFVFGSVEFVRTRTSVIYNKPVDDNVYEFDLEGTPKKVYTFDFGRMRVPDEDKKDIESNLLRYDDYCLLAGFVYVDKAYISGSMRHKGRYRDYLIDRASNTIYLQDDRFAHIKLRGFTGSTAILSLDHKEDDTALYSLVTQDVMEHLRSDGRVLMLVEF